MIKAVVAAALVLLMVCVGACMRPMKENEMYMAFDEIGSMEDLAAYMKAMGFQWKSDGFNYTPWTDFQAPAIIVWTRRWGNCNDLSGVFSDFVWYKAKQNQPVIDGALIEVYMRKRVSEGAFGWHYILLFQIGGTWYEQSNLEIRHVKDPEAACNEWRERGYTWFRERVR